MSNRRLIEALNQASHLKSIITTPSHLFYFKFSAAKNLAQSANAFFHGNYVDGVEHALRGTGRLLFCFAARYYQYSDSVANRLAYVGVALESASLTIAVARSQMEANSPKNSLAVRLA